MEAGREKLEKQRAQGVKGLPEDIDETKVSSNPYFFTENQFDLKICSKFNMLSSFQE